MTERRTTLDGLAVSLLLTCCVLWGLNQVATKVALADFPPFTQAALRSAGAALLVLAWARLRGIALFARDGTLPGGLLAGALFALEFGLIFFGLQFTTASRMVVFIYLAPFVVALGMPFVARSEKLKPVQFVGLAVAFGGVAAAFAEGFGQPSAGERQWLGDACGVGAALVWGATTLSIRSTRLAGAAPEKTLLYQLGLSALLLGMASPRYLDMSGTPNGDDDVDFESASSEPRPRWAATKSTRISLTRFLRSAGCASAARTWVL